MREATEYDFQKGTLRHMQYVTRQPLTKLKEIYGLCFIDDEYSG